MFKDDVVRVMQLHSALVIDREEARRLLGVDDLLKSLDDQAPLKEKAGPVPPTRNQSVIRVFPSGYPERNGVILVRDASNDCWRYNDGTVAPPPSQNEDFEIVYTPGKGK